MTFLFIQLEINFNLTLTYTVQQQGNRQLLFNCFTYLLFGIKFYKKNCEIFIEISQLPKLCAQISMLMHRRMWVRSFSTRLTSVTFAEDKVLIFLILRKNAKIVQL